MPVYPTPDPQTIGLVTIMWLISVLVGRGVRPIDLYSLMIAFILLYGPGGVGYAVGGMLAYSLVIVLYKWAFHQGDRSYSEDERQ